MAEVYADCWGNPSSLHGHGVRAAETLERSRWQIASAVNSDRSELLFTSGATESVHLALVGYGLAQPPGRLVISAVEHPAVNAAAMQLLRHGWQISTWPVDRFGRIDMEHCEPLLAEPTRLVSLIWGQSEVGTLQPIQTIGAICRSRGIAFHTDATQVFSQGVPDWQALSVDLMSASAHKFGGPKGAGLLLARDQQRHQLQRLQGGGGQEQGLRAGTEPVALIAGMAQAMTLLPRWIEPSVSVIGAAEVTGPVMQLRNQLLQALLADPRLELTGEHERRLPHHISLIATTHKGEPLQGRRLVRALANKGISCSSGSACSSGQDVGSAVLAAMGYSPDQQRAGLRLSLGPWNQAQDVDRVVGAIKAALDDAEALIER
jgi:cysteine desulfurase